MSESNCFLVTSSTSCLLLKLTEAQNPTKINNLYQNIFTTNYRLVQNSKKKIYHRLFFIILQEELACYTNRRQKYTRLLRRLFLNFQLLLLVLWQIFGQNAKFLDCRRAAPCPILQCCQLPKGKLSRTRKIHAQKQFLAFHGITFHFSSKM